MTHDDRAYTLEDMYGKLSISEEEFQSLLDQGLSPRGPESLYEKLAALGLTEAHQVLDIGCGDASHACELSRRFGCTVLAVDPVPYHLEKARNVISETAQSYRVTAVEGRIERIPADDGSFNFIWCRDMLNHVPDLSAGFVECMRVLKPGGTMLIFHAFATDLLEPNEAARLYPPLVVVSQNMSPVYMRATFESAGLELVEWDVVSSEWREKSEEDGTRHTAKQLLRISRMRRDRERLIAQIGLKPYETELANCHWGVYQMLGKLCPVVFVLRRPG